MGNGAGFVSKAFKAVDDLNVGIQAPYKLPVDAKEVRYRFNVTSHS